MLSLLSIIGLCSCESRETTVDIERVPIVCAEKDSVCALAANEYCSKTGYELEECNSQTDCAVMVCNGKYDYFVTDEFTESAVIENNNLTKFDKCDYKIEYRLVFSEENTELCVKLNKSIADLKGNGTIDRIEKGTEKIKVDEADNDKEIFILCDPVLDDVLYLDEDGIVQGRCADIVRAICENAGFKAVFVAKEFDELFAMLADGEGDFLLTLDSDFEEMEEYYLLSDPYADTEFYVYKRNEK